MLRSHSHCEGEYLTGGTSWIGVGSSSCGSVADGQDCFGTERVLPDREYSEKRTASLRASGQLLADRITLSNVGTDGGGGGGFVWGAAGGLFTLHGEGSAPVTVTARLAVEGVLSRSHTITFSGATWKIGLWNFGDVSSPFNERVVPDVMDGFSCAPGRCAAGSVSFAGLLGRSFAVLPGESFNLGYQVSTSTSTFSATMTASSEVTAVFSLNAGDGFFFTGPNGYDSRVSAVPEPGAAAMLLAGMALMGVRARRRSLLESPTSEEEPSPGPR
jgi:hypothetical protein